MLCPYTALRNSQYSPLRRIQWSLLSPCFHYKETEAQLKNLPEVIHLLSRKPSFETESAWQWKSMLFFLHILIFSIKVIYVHRKKKCWKPSKSIKKEVKIIQTSSLNRYFHFAINLLLFFSAGAPCVCVSVHAVMILKRDFTAYRSKIWFCSSHWIFSFEFFYINHY